MKTSPRIGALATVAAILVLLILLGTSGRLSTGYAHDMPGQRTAKLQQIVRGLVAPLTADRPMSGDIERIGEAIRTGEFAAL